MDRDTEFRQFFDAEFSSLRRLAYLLTGNWGEAEDLAQETMVRVYRSWKSITGHPGGYARTVLMNRHRSLLRRAKVEAKHAFVRREYSEQTGGLEDDALVIWQAIQKLPQREREMIVLRFYEDMPIAEIAKVLDCPTGTVKSITHRAIGKLREQIGSSIDLPAGDEA